MKHLCALLFILSFSQLHSQDISGQWFLHYISIDGTVQYSTVPNSFSDINFDLDAGFFEGTVCDNGYAGNFSSYTDSTLTISNVAAFAGYCEYDLEATVFLSPYLWTFLSYYSIDPVFDYSISGSGSDETLILTNASGDLAVYGRSQLEENPLPGNWYVYSLSIDGTEYTNTFNPDFNLNFTLIPAEISAVVLSGTAICNDYWSEYYLYDNSNTIFIDSPTVTQVVCNDDLEADFEQKFFDILAFDAPIPIFNYEVMGSGENATLELMNANGDYINLGALSLSLDGHLFDFSVAIKENPVADVITLSMPDMVTGSLSYEIYSIDGKLIQKSMMENETINVEALQSGLYFLNVLNGGGNNQILKFIKK